MATRSAMKSHVQQAGWSLDAHEHLRGDEGLYQERHPALPVRPARPELAVDFNNGPRLEAQDLYDGQDDAQHLIQPAISPVATRLTLPKTPAAEKAAAMDRALDSFFPPFPEAGVSTAGESSQELLAAISAAAPIPQGQAPRPQDAGAGLAGKQSALTSVFGGGDSRHRRASSVGSDALKKLSKALPSLSLPSGLFPHVATASLFSSSSLSSSSSRPAPPQPPTDSSYALSAFPEQPFVLKQGQAPELRLTGGTPHPDPGPRNRTSQQPLDTFGRQSRPPSLKSGQPHKLRRSMSAESVLFSTMSRVSSLGDDERFGNVREQVNSRLKAIMDSFDRPTFKMPQIPSIMSAATLRKGPSAVDGTSSRNAGPMSPSPQAIAPVRDGQSMLDAVLATMTGDVVVLGGYRGSILRSAVPPHQQLWVPMKVGLNIRKVNLEVGLNPEDEETMEERIFASAMLQNIGPVDISRRLLRRMRDSPNARAGTLRVHEFAYDWRLSPARSSRKLLQFLQGLKCNHYSTPRPSRGALVLAHSLGGLITRHAVNQRPDLFSGVGYIGVPQRCISIVGPFRNGDAVLLNEKVLTASVTFSFRTSFIFLPEDGFCFLSKDMKKKFNVDFYDPDEWVRYKLSPCVDPSVQATPRAVRKRNSNLVSLRDLSSSLSTTLPLRGWSSGDALGPSNKTGPELAKDRILALQLSSSSAADTSCTALAEGGRSSSPRGPSSPGPVDIKQTKAYTYLKRTLAETKQFRAETQHIPALTEANAYPPMAVMYGKDIPTVYAVRVASRDVIPTPEVYDDLVFRSGDGVVLAREAMLPPGYHVVSGGHVSTEKGHISMLGDFAAVARVLEALLRGRSKGLGLGIHPLSPTGET